MHVCITLLQWSFILYVCKTLVEYVVADNSTAAYYSAGRIAIVNIGVAIQSKIAGQDIQYSLT